MSIAIHKRNCERSRTQRDESKRQQTDAAFCTSGRLFLHVGFPLTKCRKPVHFRAMREGALRRGDVFRFALPDRLRGMLKRPTVREREPPRQISDLVHCIEVGGRLLVALSARKKSDSGHGSGNAILEHLYSLLCNFLDSGALAVLLSGN